MQVHIEEIGGVLRVKFDPIGAVCFCTILRTTVGFVVGGGRLGMSLTIKLLFVAWTSAFMGQNLYIYRTDD